MSDPAKTRIVLVEDYDLLRDGLRLALERDGQFEIVGEAADGVTALHKIENLKPDVVIMDIGLPQMDGISVTRELKHKYPDIKVIMLTSHDNDREIFGAFAAGAAGYCLKDVAGQKLSLAIRSVARGAVWVDPHIAATVLNCLASQGRETDSAAQPSQEQRLDLSPREMDVLRLMTEGLGNKEIADKLSISVSTVRTHVDHILEKLAVSGRTQAAVKALRMKIV
jgi:DNA-binding NarL/FixJ family response regulator